MQEARIRASISDDPKLVSEEQLESWVSDFDSWDLCDQACGLFSKTPFAHAKAAAWSSRPEEFVKRAGVSLMAELAVHGKKAPDAAFEAFLPLISAQADDPRNFVRKAVNWALRAIGKRDLLLYAAAIACAEGILDHGGRSARWVASDALRELTGDKVRATLAAKSVKHVSAIDRAKPALGRHRALHGGVDGAEVRE